MKKMVKENLIFADKFFEENINEINEKLDLINSKEFGEKSDLESQNFVNKKAEPLNLFENAQFTYNNDIIDLITNESKQFEEKTNPSKIY
jgi:hypothetical protein